MSPSPVSWIGNTRFGRSQDAAPFSAQLTTSRCDTRRPAESPRFSRRSVPFSLPQVRRTLMPGCLESLQRDSCRSLRLGRMSQLRTFPTLILGHVADAASLRGCGTHVAALQPKSQNRSFKAPPSHKFQTVLSPQTVPTLQSRDEAVSESVYLSDHASPPASARASGPGSSRIGRWIKAANRPSTTAAHHISV